MPEKSSAQLLLEKADKKTNSSTGWFGSTSTKFEEAGDLYQQAANAFRVEQLFREAGDSFAREAECREKCDEKNDAASAWWNASKAYRKGYPDLALHALEQTVDYLTKTGRFRQAGDRQKEIGQLHMENNNLIKACESFTKAANWYDTDNSPAASNGCSQTAAELYAGLEQYPQAMSLYEKVATYWLSSPLTKYSAKECWFRSALCALAFDIVTAKKNMDNYTLKDPSFSSTREAKFVRVLIEAVEGGDPEAFTAAVFEYDQVLRLDSFTTNILLKIKRSIQDEPGLT